MIRSAPPGVPRQRLLLGCFPEPRRDDLASVVELAQLADELGLELLGLQDHPYQAAYLDALTLATHLLARTSRVTVFTDVANLPLRPPALLARAAASMSLTSAGRFQLGLGAGGFWDAIWAMGGPRRRPGESVEALEEAIAVIRLLWSGQPSASFAGRHYRLSGARPGPAPDPMPEIWVGAYGPRMLSLVGRVADGWLPSSPYAAPEKLPQMTARIEAAAERAGRDPRAVRRLYNVQGAITDGRRAGFLQGPPESWVEDLLPLVVEQGFGGFILWPVEPRSEQVRRFALEVGPLLRQAVGEESPPGDGTAAPGEPGRRVPPV